MKYGEIKLGQVEAVWNKLGGEEGVSRFLAGETVVSVPPKVWQTWRTIKLGTGPRTADDFRVALRKANCQIGDWGNDILSQPAFLASSKKMEVDLAVVTLAEFGFKSGAKRSDIYRRAQELGLDLCPNEVGPQLRLQYTTDQPNGEWLFIAMEPITDSDGRLEVFVVERSARGELWLGGGHGHPDDFWDAGGRFVFLCRK